MKNKIRWQAPEQTQQGHFMRTLPSGLITLCLLSFIGIYTTALGQPANILARRATSLDGTWQILVDQYDRFTGVREGQITKAYTAKNKSERVEFAFSFANTLQVPGDWNTQQSSLFFYEGSILYKREYDHHANPGSRYFLHFGAVNYRAEVYLNGALIGTHDGGFTPFAIECTDLFKEGRNVLVVRVNNARKPDRVPAMDFDWWNFGGITRSVAVVEVPDGFIRDYSLGLAKGKEKTIEGWVTLEGKDIPESVELLCTELGLRKEMPTSGKRSVFFTVKADVTLWSPEHPKLYGITFVAGKDTIHDRIGFRAVATRGNKILVNGRPVFLRGISIHEEALFTGGRIANPTEMRTLLLYAKELNCNFVRLAHYPHNEETLRMADELGLMVWAEVPVWQNISFSNEATAAIALQQLSEMITRDRNRASIILWSVSNETDPETPGRLEFLRSMIDAARSLDSTRLITSALHKQVVNDSTLRFDDPLGKYLDVLAVNEYLGWYQGVPEDCWRCVWQTVYDKPHLVSEFGAEALYGNHADSLTVWSEEFQARVYRRQCEMIDRIPFVCGLSPWILKDFRSPRRLHPEYQNYFNRKGVISNEGQRKMAFSVLQEYYLTKSSYGE
jgi:beta-glucuronidase